MKRVLGLLGAVALAAGAGVAIIGIEIPGGQVLTLLGPSTLTLLPDGGPVYATRALSLDGGIGFTLTAVPGCVRRPVGVSHVLCQRNAPGRGLYDQDDLDRFPLLEAVGVGCEAVACGIFAGEPPAETDAAKTTRLQAVVADGGTLP